MKSPTANATKLATERAAPSDCYRGHPQRPPSELYDSLNVVRVKAQVSLPGRFPVGCAATNLRFEKGLTQRLDWLMSGALIPSVVDLHIALAQFGDALTAATNPEQPRPAGLPFGTLLRLPLIWARNFVVALDLLRSSVQQMADKTQCGAEIYKELDDRFPKLQDLRNTVAHLEERSQELARDKEIPRAPDATPFRVVGSIVGSGALGAGNQPVEPDDLSFVLDCVWPPDRYLARLESGMTGELAIADATVLDAIETLRRFLHQFEWGGHDIVFPEFIST